MLNSKHDKGHMTMTATDNVAEAERKKTKCGVQQSQRGSVRVVLVENLSSNSPCT